MIKGVTFATIGILYVYVNSYYMFALWDLKHHAMCYPAELTGSQNSCQLNMRRISIVCNNVYAMSTILLLYYIYVFIFIYLYL